MQYYIKKGKNYIPADSDDTFTLEDGIILNCAFRYALGRQSYVVGVLVNTLIKNFRKINIHDRTRIANEIEKAINERLAGSKYDVVEWRRVMHLFRKENHCKIKAFYAAENRIEGPGKEYPPIKVSDKYKVVDAVKMDDKYYALDMKRYYHTIKELNNKGEEI